MAKPLGVPSLAKPLSFRYVGVDEQGQEMRGRVKALTEVEARRLLSERGVQAMTVEVAPSPFAVEQLLPSLFRVKPRELVVFSRQLATLLQSGLSLLPALELLQSHKATGRELRRVLGAITYDLRSGYFLSQAAAKHPQVFSDIYVRTIAVGERTGRLETVLRQMADYYEKQGAVAKKLTGALTYPAIVMVFGVLVVIILTQVALPPLVNMFQAMNVNLPLPTRILIALTQFTNAYRLPMLAGFLVLVAGAAWFLRQPAGQQFWDRARLTIPILGPPTLMAELARFSRTVSILVAAGLPLQDIMTTMPQTTSNRVIRRSLGRIQEGLMLGQGLSGPMAAEPLFPPLLVQMVAVGEESNSLDFTLGVVADFYETAAEEKMAALVGFIQPAVTLAMALVTGFIALSVIMPMYTITGAF